MGKKRVKRIKVYELSVKCKTIKQALKCYNLMFLNMGYLGKLSINKYEKLVLFEKLPFKHPIITITKLIKSKKLRFEKITLKETSKEIRTEDLGLI